MTVGGDYGSPVGQLAGDRGDQRQRERGVDLAGRVSCPSDYGEPYIGDSSPHYSIKVGGGFNGVKTNYDFCVNPDMRCNAWRVCDRNVRGGCSARTAPAKRPTCATDSRTRSPWPKQPTTCGTASCPAWGYRGWVMMGIDPGLLRHQRLGVARRHDHRSDSGATGKLGPHGQPASRRRARDAGRRLGTMVERNHRLGYTGTAFGHGRRRSSYDPMKSQKIQTCADWSGLPRVLCCWSRLPVAAAKFPISRR